MNTEIIEVTPQLAEQYLTHNTRNRNVSKARVKQILDDIEHNRWDLHHQGIGFYEDGALADGQTRLTAIKESGRAVKIMVTWGLPNKTGSSIDRHRPRSDADSIRIGGLAEWIGKDQVSLVKMIAAAHQKNTPTYSAKHLAMIGEELRNEVQFALAAFTSRKRNITTSPVMAAVAIASRTVDPIRLLEFVDVLVHGVPHTMDDVAAIRLREQLITDRGRGGQTARGETLRKTMRAIKAFENKEQLRKLYTPSEMIYEIEGLQEIL